MAGETVSPQAEQAGTVVETAIANAETNAAVAIETAAAQVDAAQAVAADISRAAMETDLGRQISDLNGRFEQWRNEQNQQVTELREDQEVIQSGLTQALDRIATALTPPQVVIAEPSVSTQTPPPPVEPPALPASADGPPVAPISPAPPPPKPRRRAI